MRWHSSIGTALTRVALALQIGLLVAPVLDAVQFHADARPVGVHVEAAGAECHTAQCALANPFVTGLSDLPSHDAIRIAADVGAPIQATSAPVFAPPAAGIPIGPRAPPAVS